MTRTIESLKRQLIAESLARAKDFLADSEPPLGKEKYICLALDAAKKQGVISRVGQEAAEAIIMERLGGAYTACTWLRDTVGEKSFNSASDIDIQAWRHRWVDSLIKEFSK